MGSEMCIRDSLSTVQATGHLDLQTQNAGTLSALHSHADGAAEGHTLLQLLGDVFRQQESVGIDPFHFNHVDPHLTARITNGFLDAGAKVFDAAALAADQHAGTCSFEFHLKLIGFAGDQDIADAGGAVLLVDELADPIIFLKKGRITFAGGVPAGPVLLGDPQA